VTSFVAAAIGKPKRCGKLSRRFALRPKSCGLSSNRNLAPIPLGREALSDTTLSADAPKTRKQSRSKISFRIVKLTHVTRDALKCGDKY
jgi:hypothetical protein